MRYGVRFATDRDMPEDHDVVVLRSDDEAIVVYRESVVDKDAVTTAWSVLRALADEDDEPAAPDDDLMPRRMLRQGLSDRGWAGSERQVRGGGCGYLRVRE